MDRQLLSVGLDVGTTTTQMVVSRLVVKNSASQFAVPQMQIAERKLLYTGPVRFTPLLGADRVDGPALQALLQEEYRAAGITAEQVDTGAVIITGETSRKENARTVLEALAQKAGDFVVATAGPHLESVLAAKGAGALEYSLQTGRQVLHMDIGGGTSNLAWICQGRIQRTGCLNVGGRLVTVDENGTVTGLSPVLRPLTQLRPGQQLTKEAAWQLAGLLVQALEMAAGLRTPTALLEQLWTREAGPVWQLPPPEKVLSFSGGVADCLRGQRPDFAYGDIGPVLARAIRQSRLCGEDYRLPEKPIRATVIGAGCHSTQLSGSTVFYQNVQFPLRDLPVCSTWQDQPAVLAMEGFPAPGYGQVCALADRLAAERPAGPIYVALEQDMAKALGQALALRLPPQTAILCMDRLQLPPDSYLDVGAPVGPCLPVVIKTLVLESNQEDGYETKDDPVGKNI